MGEVGQPWFASVAFRMERRWVLFICCAWVAEKPYHLCYRLMIDSIAIGPKTILLVVVVMAGDTLVGMDLFNVGDFGFLFGMLLCDICLEDSHQYEMSGLSGCWRLHQLTRRGRIPDDASLWAAGFFSAIFVVFRIIIFSIIRYVQIDLCSK